MDVVPVSTCKKRMIKQAIQYDKYRHNLCREVNVQNIIPRQTHVVIIQRSCACSCNTSNNLSNELSKETKNRIIYNLTTGQKSSNEEHYEHYPLNLIEKHLWVESPMPSFVKAQ